MKRIVIAGALCGLALTGCGAGSDTAAPPPNPSTTTSAAEPSVTPTTTAADPSTASSPVPNIVSVKTTCRAVYDAIQDGTDVFGYPRSHAFPDRLDALAEQADPRIVADVRAYSSVTTAFLLADALGRSDTAGLIDAAFLRINSSCMGQVGVSLR
jgi:hypothetical protein